MWCDMQGPNGGWILLQERRNAAINFYRNWVSYEKGFGEPGVGYWLGNINMHSITLKKKYALRIDLPSFFDELNVRLMAKYDSFRLLGPSTGYVIKLGQFLSGLSDILSKVNNSAFSTWDRDNDKVDGACARARKSAWWYGRTCSVFDINSMRLFIKAKIKAKELFEGNPVMCNLHYLQLNVQQTRENLSYINENG